MESLALVFKKKTDPSLFPLNSHLPSAVHLLGKLKVVFFLLHVAE